MIYFQLCMFLSDLRARLEMAIARVQELAEASENNLSLVPSYPRYGHHSDSHQPYLSYNLQLTTAVRKYLVPCIRDLCQHGTCSAQSTSLVPFMGCFPRRASYSETHIHPWELILGCSQCFSSLNYFYSLNISEYYRLKNGEKYNSTPARKLSQSFNLDIAGASPNCNKHNMLCAIGTIISTHTPYKRSYDSHFKAFICSALK